MKIKFRGKRVDNGEWVGFPLVGGQVKPVVRLLRIRVSDNLDNYGNMQGANPCHQSIVL